MVRWSWDIRLGWRNPEAGIRDTVTSLRYLRRNLRLIRVSRDNACESLRERLFFTKVGFTEYLNALCLR